MTETPKRYGSKSDLNANRIHFVAVLHAAADWLSTVTDEKLPGVLRGLGPLVDELARAASFDGERKSSSPLQP